MLFHARLLQQGLRARFQLLYIGEGERLACPALGRLGGEGSVAMLLDCRGSARFCGGELLFWGSKVRELGDFREEKLAGLHQVPAGIHEERGFGRVAREGSAERHGRRQNRR